MEKKVAVVILNWNGEALLRKYLPSVIEYSNNNLANVYVIDNDSKDDSIEIMKNNYHEVKIIHLDKNYGFAGGYNKGLKEIKEKYIVLLNSDVRVSPKWLEPMIDLLDKDSKLVAVQPKILSDRNSEYFEHAGACGGYIDYLGYPFCRGRIVADVEKDESQYDESKEIFWASGAALFIRNSIYKQVGGLDERFFAHMEEIDLCWRLHSLGYKIKCEPKSTVYHFGGASLGYDNPRKLYLNFRNSLFMLYKNLNNDVFYKTMFFRLLLDGVAAFMFLLKFQFKNFVSVWNAHIDFYSSLKKFKKDRIEIQSKSKIKNISTIYNRSIIMKYYLFSLKKFSQIKNFIS